SISFLIFSLHDALPILGIDVVFSVMMKTAHDVLMNTSFYIMAVAILAGAVAAIMSEFGVIALINKVISVVMRPLFGLPGAAALGDRKSTRLNSSHVSLS